jgi:hypothetical protein
MHTALLSLAAVLVIVPLIVVLGALVDFVKVEAVMADAFYVAVGAVSTLWNRLTSIPPIEWIATCATFATLALIFISRHVERIRELMEGPTGRCRYCQRRYASPEHRGFLDRTCDRRACRRQYERYRAAFHEAGRRDE